MDTDLMAYENSYKNKISDFCANLILKVFTNNFVKTLTTLYAMMALSFAAQADEIQVMASVAFKEPYLRRVAQFEKSGNTVKTTWLPTVQIIKKIQSNEFPDLVIMDGKSVDDLINQGKLRAESKVDYVSSGIGIGVPKGGKHPMISTTQDLKNTLLSTQSLAYSTGPSGVYLAALFEQMGISEQLKPKTKIIQGEPVGNAVKRGEVAMAFQQIPEILSVPEIEFAGPLPAEIQYVTTFSFSVPTSSPVKPSVQDLISWLKSPDGFADIKAHGLEPK
jgi:molybdate transport system substrate-binding protein